MLSERVQNRLYNWKFGQAAEYYRQDDEGTEKEGALIEALARAFGDCGWFEGDMALLVSTAVSFLVGDDDD